MADRGGEQPIIPRGEAAEILQEVDNTPRKNREAKRKEIAEEYGVSLKTIKNLKWRLMKRKR